MVPDTDAPRDQTDEGSPRPPTRVPGVWAQIPMPVRIALVVLLLVAAGGIFAVTRQTSESSANLDNGVIQQLIPAEASQVPQQAQVGIDLADGYNASLAVNGVAIPDDQTDRIVAFNQVLFQPGPGKVFEAWDASVPTCVTATYWKYDTPDVTTPRTWCFSVV